MTLSLFFSVGDEARICPIERSIFSMLAMLH
jgi:hypothetical protein